MLAGLWSEWHSKEQNRTLNTCSIVTTKANPLMAKIHNNPKLSEARMPLILRDGAEDNWLRLQTEQQLKLFLEPYPQEELRAMPEKKNQPRIPGL
jgi:putative SOS response-associated peptidase YedK